MNPHERRKLDVPQRIETERLILRVLGPGDGERLFECFSESLDRLQPWFHWAQKASSLETNRLHVRSTMVEYYNRGNLEFGIYYKENNNLIGRIGIHEVSWDPIIRELGYWLRTGYEGHGYMSEAVDALIRVCFTQLQATKIVIRAESENERSQNVAKRAGFTYEGTARHYQPSNADNTCMADMCFFSLLKTEWQEAK